jgi:hypothetical protein
MADTSITTPNKVHTISESERSQFYAWASEQGFTRLNATCEELLEELWRDPKGQIISAGRMVAEHADWRRPEPRDVPGPARKPVQKNAGAEHTSASQDRIQWLQLYPTMALAIILVGAFQLVIDSRHTVSAATTVATESAQASTTSDEETRLGLTVTPRADRLEIRWNPKSDGIAASDRGEMKITENGITEDMPFDQAQLRDGYVVYGPRTNDVNIRLQVTSKNGLTTSESVRSVTIP